MWIALAIYAAVGWCVINYVSDNYRFKGRLLTRSAKSAFAPIIPLALVMLCVGLIVDRTLNLLPIFKD